MSCTVKPPVHVISVYGGPELYQGPHFGKASQECNPASQVVLVVKNPTCQCRRYKRCGFDAWARNIPLEKGLATHSSILAWRIP